MAYQIVLKKELQNEMAIWTDDIPKELIVASYTITDGFLEKGGYHIPISSILFIKEV